MAYYVYILASRPHGAIYVGVTNDLPRRIDQYKNGEASAHTRKYNIFRLVYFETFDHIDDAITFEKRLKKWRRAWKDGLIEKHNPNWDELTPP